MVVFIKEKKTILSWGKRDETEQQMRLWKQKAEYENLVAGSSVQKSIVHQKPAATETAIPSPVFYRA